MLIKKTNNKTKISALVMSAVNYYYDYFEMKHDDKILICSV